MCRKLSRRFLLLQLQFVYKTMRVPMCPISGALQCFIVIVFLLLFLHKAVAQLADYKWSIMYENLKEPIHMHETVDVQYNISSGVSEILDDYYVYIKSENSHIAEAEKQVYLKNDSQGGFHSGMFNITGNFLGQTTVTFKVKIADFGTVHNASMDVTVIREVRAIDTVFTASVATLVSIIYVNFGCALNWAEFRKSLRRPIGPLIGLFCQFGFMPACSYALGRILFPDNPEMQLGFFFTGCSPSGGASNIWTVLLEGNMDLSVTMTALCTIAAFGMMPLWIFTLGRVIFESGNLAVPYSQISMYAVALIVPLFIGFLIQRYLKKVGRFLVRILKGFSALLIIFIIVFAVATNLYLFELFSWQIVVAGLGLPWLGYVFGFALSYILKQPAPDRLAISIETGIQNTGIAIFLLRFCLPQPQADLTTVAPVSVAIMTPFPLLFLYIYKKLWERIVHKHKKLETEIPSIEVDNNFNKDTPKVVSTISS